LSNRKGDLTPNQRRKLRNYFKEINAPCSICGLLIDYEAPTTEPYSINLDHIIPMNKGGTSDLSNIQPTHKICNQRKHDDFLVKREKVERRGFKATRKW